MTIKKLQFNNFENALFFYLPDKIENCTEDEINDAVNELINDECSSSYSLIEIKPIFKKDGFYFDTVKNFAWYEWRNKAFTKPNLSKYFEYEFNLIEYENKRISNKTFDALKIVLRTIKSKELIDIYCKEEQLRMLDSIYLESYKRRLELLNEYH